MLRYNEMVYASNEKLFIEFEEKKKFPKNPKTIIMLSIPSNEIQLNVIILVKVLNLLLFFLSKIQF